MIGRDIILYVDIDGKLYGAMRWTGYLLIARKIFNFLRNEFNG